jgi:hypothetical protein
MKPGPQLLGVALASQGSPDTKSPSPHFGMRAVQAEAIGLIPATYCQEPGVCGEGQITGAETCDDSATVRRRVRDRAGIAARRA